MVYFWEFGKGLNGKQKWKIRFKFLKEMSYFVFVFILENYKIKKMIVQMDL